MIKSLIRIGLLLVVGILAYNYFFGTTEEKAQSKEVFKKTGDAVKSAWNVLKAEKSKFDAGKYDKVMSKLGDAYRSLRSQAGKLDAGVIRKLDELEQRKRALEPEIQALEQESKSDPYPSGSVQEREENARQQNERKRELLEKLDSLVKDTDRLLEEAGSN